jgi:hypothetical protein
VRDWFLSPVLAHRLVAGVRIGLVTWASTAGMLMGFGLRHGTAALPFARFGSWIMGGGGATRLTYGLAAGAGAIGHAFWMVIWGVGFWSLARTRGILPSVIVALLLVTMATFVSAAWLPAALGAVRFASLAPVQVAVVGAVMTATLVISRTFANDH